MTVPTTTPGSLDRIWNRITLAACLLAALAILGATLTASSARASEPKPPRTYKVTADVDGRHTPSKNEHRVHELRAQERARAHRVPGVRRPRLRQPLVGPGVEGRRDAVRAADRFVKTGTSGHAPGIRLCTEDELNQ